MQFARLAVCCCRSRRSLPLPMMPPKSAAAAAASSSTPSPKSPVSSAQVRPAAPDAPGVTEPCIVFVVGEVNSGKSSLINALSGGIVSNTSIQRETFKPIW